MDVRLKKRKELGEFKAHKKTPPQFADANEEGVYRSAVQNHQTATTFLSSTKKLICSEEFLCQARRRVRSLLDVNEELAYRSAVQNLPEIISFCIGVPLV